MHIERLGCQIQEILASSASSLKEAEERLIVSPFGGYIIGKNNFLGHIWSLIWSAVRLINWDGSWRQASFHRALTLTAQTWLDVHKAVITSQQTLKTFLRTRGHSERILETKELVFQHLLSYRIYIGKLLEENTKASFEVSVNQLNRLFQGCLSAPQPTASDIRECLQDGAYLYLGSHLGTEAFLPVQTTEKILHGDRTDLEDEKVWHLFIDKILEKIDGFTPDVLVRALQRYAEHLGLSAGFLSLLFLLKESFAQRGQAHFWQSNDPLHTKEVDRLVYDREGVVGDLHVGEIVREDEDFFTFSLLGDDDHLLLMSKHSKSHLLTEAAAFLHSCWRGLLPKTSLLDAGRGLLVEKLAPFPLLSSPDSLAAKQIIELVKILQTERKWPLTLKLSDIGLYEGQLRLTRPLHLSSSVNVYDQAAFFLFSLSSSRDLFLALASQAQLTKHPASLYYKTALHNSLGGLQENLSRKRSLIQEINEPELQQNTAHLITSFAKLIEQCSLSLTAKYALPFAFPIKQLLGPPLIEEIFSLPVAALPYSLSDDKAASYALEAAHKEKLPLLPTALDLLKKRYTAGERPTSYAEWGLFNAQQLTEFKDFCTKTPAVGIAV